MHDVNVSIKSLSIAMPEKYYTNQDPPYRDIPNVPKNWWRFWGIKGRYLINKEGNETAQDLAEKACKKAIALAKLTPEDIDMVLCNSTCLVGWGKSNEQAFPRFSNQLKQTLGLKNAIVMDVEQECITFLISVQIGVNYLRSGRYKNILVCSSEYISGVLDFSDISSTTFGDGAAAAIISNEDNEFHGANMLSSAYGSNADFYELALVKWKYPENLHIDDRKPEDYWSYFSLNKNAPEEMQKFVPVAVPEIIRKALQKADMTKEEIDFYVFHQPSKILVTLWANALEVPDEKFLLTLEHYGCMVSVSMPVTLYEGVKTGKIKEGATIAIAGAATGWGFGAQIWKIGNISI